MTTRAILAATLLAAAGPAVADQPRIYQSTTGDQFAMTCNPAGHVLTEVRTGTQVFLGRDCDTYAPRFGTGSWCAANGGTFVEVGTQSILLPRQEPYCPGVGFSPWSYPCG
jgi:hypothetical protein